MNDVLGRPTTRVAPPGSCLVRAGHAATTTSSIDGSSTTRKRHVTKSWMETWHIDIHKEQSHKQVDARIDVQKPPVRLNLELQSFPEEKIHGDSVLTTPGLHAEKIQWGGGPKRLGLTAHV
ncbi:hypothetical protein COCC4DRAFT_22437 [Bipolaris maydis ATCC 48331]|uniref:Uncharacterized protein n=2 Tax=Cochliobolus heterostrophus TaxID=5016 RepID=M2TI64_COCH5|nr:uncharacterized protein COCC4DRAFT_22437 [Bipolaris maydis ATCC 48331]EMD86194.1 hypothetical protein COCHEDRAFT_1034656 [Bipolaris maydis C5]ENI06143.1 hypothetical protein COCC4DRAFT_22437 [Bipolaris maydis ATCC 48331]